MIPTYAPGRHRSDQKATLWSQLTSVAGSGSQPAAKSAAVVAASAGLLAALAVPAAAGSSDPAVDVALPAAAPANQTSVGVTAARSASPVALTAVGLAGYSAVAKPKPKPKPQPIVVHATDAVSRSSSRSSTSVASRVFASDKAAAGGVIAIAKTLLGIPYVYAGTTPAGFDCSGFTQYIFRKVGINLPRTAEQQRQYSTRVSNPQPGDLVFFGVPAYHVGIYAGPGMMYDSPTTGKSTSLRAIWTSNVTYGRP